MEIWRQIKGYPNYQISNYGNVKSLARKVPCYGGFRNKRETILAPVTDSDGYLKVTLYNNNRSKNFFIHILVLETFVGLRPLNHETRHLDGTRTNNNLTNLVWGTGAENYQDRRN